MMPRAYYFVVVVTALMFFLLLSVKAVTAAAQLTGDDEEEALKADLLAQLQSQDTGSSSLINEEEGGGGGGDDEAAVQISMTFVNEFPDRTIDIYWINPDYDGQEGEEERKFEGSIHWRGDSITVDTFAGHEYVYDVGDGTKHYLTMYEGKHEQQQIILAGNGDGFLVQCDMKLTSSINNEMSSFEIIVKPYWSHRGASRFLELVRHGYYNGVALNRVVPRFLIQFGIARDVELRNAYSYETILDDEPSSDIPKFEPGYVSFAGSGPDSRTTEMFIVMPDTDEEQLEYFGTNSWETPFGYVRDVGNLSKIFSGYGDMPPEGNGPDSSRIYDEDGYDYLAEHFPNLDYIERCYIVDEEEGISEEL